MSDLETFKELLRGMAEAKSTTELWFRQAAFMLWCGDNPDKLANLIAHPAQPPAQVDAPAPVSKEPGEAQAIQESWWLIEVQDGVAWWATGDSGEHGLVWTNDAHKAMRFKTREAAENMKTQMRYWDYDKNGGYNAARITVAEHIFIYEFPSAPLPEARGAEEAAVDIIDRYMKSFLGDEDVTNGIVAIIRKHIRHTHAPGEGWVMQQKFDAVERQYNELIYAVARKYKDESRHATALRYIREREEQAAQSGSDKAAAPQAEGK